MTAGAAPPVPGAPAAAPASPGGRRRSSGALPPGETGLRSVAGLARVAPRLAFGGPPECPEEVYCLLGLKQVYGLRFRVFIPLDAGGPLTLQALEAGDIGVALLFSTDPAITTDHLVVLAALNARVELRGQDPRLVAQSWLRAQGLASIGEVSR